MSTAVKSSHFPLFRYFLAFSVLIVGVVVYGQVTFKGELARRDLIIVNETNNVALTQAFANSVWPKFSTFVSSVGDLTGEELRS